MVHDVDDEDNDEYVDGDSSLTRPPWESLTLRQFLSMLNNKAHSSTVSTMEPIVNVMSRMRRDTIVLKRKQRVVYMGPLPLSAQSLTHDFYRDNRLSSLSPPYFTTTLKRHQDDGLKRVIEEDDDDFCDDEEYDEKCDDDVHMNNSSVEYGEQLGEHGKNGDENTMSFEHIVGEKLTWSMILLLLRSCLMNEKVDLAEKLIFELFSNESFLSCFRSFHFNTLIDTVTQFSHHLQCSKLLSMILETAENSAVVRSVEGKAPLFSLLRTVLTEGLDWDALPKLTRLMQDQLSQSHQISMFYHLRPLILMEGCPLQAHGGDAGGSGSRTVNSGHHDDQQYHLINSSCIIYYLTSLKKYISQNGHLFISSHSAYERSSFFIHVMVLLYHLGRKDEIQRWQRLAADLNMPLYPSGFTAPFTYNVEKYGFQYGLEFLHNFRTYFEMEPRRVLFRELAPHVMNVGHVNALLNEMKQQGLSPHPKMYYSLLRRLIHWNLIDDAKQVYRDMQQLYPLRSHSPALLSIVTAFAPGPEVEDLIRSLRFRHVLHLSPEQFTVLWHRSKTYPAWVFEQLSSPHFNTRAKPSSLRSVPQLLSYLQHEDIKSYSKLNKILPGHKHAPA